MAPTTRIWLLSSVSRARYAVAAKQRRRSALKRAWSGQIARSVRASVEKIELNGHATVSSNGHEARRFPPTLPAVIVPIIQKPRRRWPREIGQAVAAGLVLLLVGALLVALFDNRIHNDGSVGQGSLGHEGRSLVATPAGTPEGTRTPWEANAAANELHTRRLGKDFHLVQRAGDYAITLNWAGDDGNHLFVYYTISGPTGQPFNSMMLYGAKLTRSDGARLAPAGGVGTGNDGCVHR